MGEITSGIIWVHWLMDGRMVIFSDRKDYVHYLRMIDMDGYIYDHDYVTCDGYHYSFGEEVKP